MAPDGKKIEIVCTDGLVLGGHLWAEAGRPPLSTVVINPATGVLARYYHYYARFLAAQGFDVITYDYRGIGELRPTSLRGCRYLWHDWGELDLDAVLRFASARSPDGSLQVVGHSIGGFLPGLAENGRLISRMLTIGAQYAYWRDYAPDHRLRLFAKWHVAMPLLTALCGYFPGKRLGWLEDLPAGVANEWSFRRSRMELSHPAEERSAVLHRFTQVSAPILAVVVSDDDIGTAPGVLRTLAYYGSAERTPVLLSPEDAGQPSVGHFGLFHARHESGFWTDTLAWLRNGSNPWPQRKIDLPVPL